MQKYKNRVFNQAINRKHGFFIISYGKGEEEPRYPKIILR